MGSIFFLYFISKFYFIFLSSYLRGYETIPKLTGTAFPSPCHGNVQYGMILNTNVKEAQKRDIFLDI
jgi:hypothetical protein